MGLYELITWPNAILFLFFCAFVLYLVFTSWWGNPPHPLDKTKINNNRYSSGRENINDNFNGDLFKLNKDRRNSQLNLEELYIKKEEHENDIEKLEQEWIMDFKKEKENKTKIKRLRLNIEHLDIKIYEMIEKLNELDAKIQQYDW